MGSTTSPSRPLSVRRPLGPWIRCAETVLGRALRRGVRGQNTMRRRSTREDHMLASVEVHGEDRPAPAVDDICNASVGVHCDGRGEVRDRASAPDGRDLSRSEVDADEIAGVARR